MGKAKKALLVVVAVAVFAGGCEWELHQNDWGDEWWSLEADGGWGDLKMVCFRDDGPDVQLAALGHTVSNRWHQVEYRIGDGPVVTQQWHVPRSSAFGVTVFRFYDNRWELQRALSSGEGPLKLRWADYWGEWRELTFTDPSGADKVAEHLDRKCKFLSDEPIRNGPSITPDDIDQSCIENANRVIAAQGWGYTIRSAAYVEHSTLTDAGMRACRVVVSGAGHPGAYVCWDDHVTWAVYAAAGLDVCLTHYRETRPD